MNKLKVDVKVDVKITESWCRSSGKPCSDKDIVTLKPGRTTSGDIDGYQVPKGKKYLVEYDDFIGGWVWCVPSGWHKIDDLPRE